MRELKQGMIYSRNRGFDTAKHEIIAQIDADVVVPTDWIKQIKKNFEKKNKEHPESFFLEYPTRMFKTFWANKK